MVVPAFRETWTWLEKWPERNLMKFSKGKCKLLHMVRNQHTVGLADWEAALQKGIWEFLANDKLNMRQQRALTPSWQRWPTAF